MQQLNHNLLNMIYEEAKIDRVYVVNISPDQDILDSDSEAYLIFEKRVPKRIFRDKERAVDFVLDMYRNANDKKFMFFFYHYKMMGNKYYHIKCLKDYFDDELYYYMRNNFEDNKIEYDKYSNNPFEYLSNSPFAKKVFDYGLGDIKRGLEEDGWVVVDYEKACYIECQELV